MAKACLEGAENLRRVRSTEVGGDDEGPVEPGAETLGQQVVGLASGERSRVVACVTERQTHREQRER